MLDLAAVKWIDHPSNPLIEPPRPEWMIADPTVLDPSRSPDAQWHLYANSVGFIHHFISDDGIAWQKIGKRLFRGMRPFLYVEEGTYYLLYELHRSPWHSDIVVRRSRDLYGWDERQILLSPSTPYDGAVFRFTGNPCLVKTAGEYRLYYSCGWIWLGDCHYFEPKYIGLATSPFLLGPYTRRPEMLIGPEPQDPYLNFGAGSGKVIPDGAGGWWMFQNSIYRDRELRSRSAIFLWHSRDGIEFVRRTPEPIVAPEPTGWKKAFVYAFDIVPHGNQIRLYYNARDGWFRGSERIGLAVAEPKR